ncbi:hypothetical protein D9601_13260 [Sphingomonas sp. MA1305]|nr:hypothetical protein [Sphingomonas sp. MA1305]
MLWHVTMAGEALFSLSCWWLVYGALRYRRDLPSKHSDRLQYQTQPQLYIFAVLVWAMVGVMTALLFWLYAFVMITGRPPFI